MKLKFVLKGGAGSGNHGHEGIPGHRGGSLPQGGATPPDRFNPFDPKSKKLPMPDTKAKFADKTTQQLWDMQAKAPVGSMEEHHISLEINRRYDEEHQDPGIKPFVGKKVTEDNLNDVVSSIMDTVEAKYPMNDEGGWSENAWKRKINPMINKIKAQLVFTEDTDKIFDDIIGSEYDSRL